MILNSVYSRTLTGQRAIRYTVEESPRLLHPSNPRLKDAVMSSSKKADTPGRALVVMDAGVARYFGAEVASYFANSNIDMLPMVIPTSERLKNIRSALRVIDTFDRFGILRRSEPVVAIGGGVLMDIVGFAASTYRRGIPYIRVPTTLMGLIDAGVGVKTGVSYGGSKNRIGAYHAPQLALLDRTFLKTLPLRHLRNGAAEALKMGLICDPVIVDLLESEGTAILSDRLQNLDCSTELFHRAIDTMLTELEVNFWEENLERIVDYGHTFSPSFEIHADPLRLHGEAVSIDMALCLVVSHNRGFISRADLDRLLGIFQILRLPIYDSVCTEYHLERSLADAIRHRDGKQRIPLVTSVGRADFFDDVSLAELTAAAAELKRHAASVEEVSQRPRRLTGRPLVDMHPSSKAVYE